MKLAALLVGLVVLAPQRDVRVHATIEPATVPIGGRATLSIVAETNGPIAQIRMPTLPPGLEILSSQDFTELRFSVPGGRRRVTRRDLVILVRAAGQFEIPPVVVLVDGGEYRTRAVLLNGGGAVATPAPPAPPPASARRGPDGEVVFHAGLSPDTVYVGQQVTLRAEALFHVDMRLRLRRAPEYVPPTPTGFWIQELPAIPFERRIDEGRVYELQGFRRAYFPLAPGRHVLPPARLQYEIRRGFLYPAEAVDLASDSLELLVLPLPQEGIPSSFTGAVGRFRLRSMIEPSSVAAGEAATLTVEIEGIGNIRGLPPPDLRDQPGVDIYPPSEQAVVRAGSAWISGVKTFSWVVVPRREGRIELPIEYGYFDPFMQEYAIASTDPLTLDVRGGAVLAAADPATLRPLHAAPGRATRLGFVRSPPFAALQALPLLLLAGALATRRRSARRQPRTRALRRHRQAALDRLLAATGVASVRFFRDLDATIRESLLLLLADPRSERAAPAELAQLLVAAGVNEATARDLELLLTRVERAPYEPTLPGVGERRALVGRAAQLLAAVELALRPRGWSPLGMVVPGLLAGALLGAPSGSAASQTNGEPFHAGVTSFGEGRYAEAAGHFHAHLQARPADAAGWYNLANAYFMDGETGRAAWAWLRALEIAPRDGNARHNLAVAGVDDRLVAAATPWLPLNREEALLLLSLCWLVAGSLGVLAHLRPGLRRRLLPPALIAASLLLLLAASLAGELRSRPAIVTAASAELLSAPARGAEVVRGVQPAAGVRVVDRREDWLRVRTFTGVEGWIHVDQVGHLGHGVSRPAPTPLVPRAGRNGSS
jgi:tetratricopeptide (TPR) repeat protein